MKIKLSNLGLRSTTGELRPGVDSSSSTSYQSAGSGSDISELFYQESTGILSDERLGTDRNVWIAFSSIDGGTVPTQGDAIDIDTTGNGTNDTTYEISEIKAELFSDFEDHYEIKVREPNG